MSGEQRFLHWAPKAVEESPYTACGLHVDSGIAWTRSTDLESYKHRPYEFWPSPCAVCLEAAAAAAAARVREAAP